MGDVPQANFPSSDLPCSFKQSADLSASATRLDTQLLPRDQVSRELHDTAGPARTACPVMSTENSRSSCATVVHSPDHAKRPVAATQADLFDPNLSIDQPPMRPLRGSPARAQRGRLSSITFEAPGNSSRRDIAPQKTNPIKKTVTFANPSRDPAEQDRGRPTPWTVSAISSSSSRSCSSSPNESVLKPVALQDGMRSRLSKLPNLKSRSRTISIVPDHLLSSSSEYDESSDTSDHSVKYLLTRRRTTPVKRRSTWVRPKRSARSVHRVHPLPATTVKGNIQASNLHDSHDRDSHSSTDPSLSLDTVQIHGFRNLEAAHKSSDLTESIHKKDDKQHIRPVGRAARTHSQVDRFQGDRVDAMPSSIMRKKKVLEWLPDVPTSMKDSADPSYEQGVTGGVKKSIHPRVSGSQEGALDESSELQHDAAPANVTPRTNKTPLDCPKLQAPLPPSPPAPPVPPKNDMEHDPASDLPLSLEPKHGRRRAVGLTPNDNKRAARIYSSAPLPASPADDEGPLRISDSSTSLGSLKEAQFPGPHPSELRECARYLGRSYNPGPGQKRNGVIFSRDNKVTDSSRSIVEGTTVPRNAATGNGPLTATPAVNDGSVQTAVQQTMVEKSRPSSVAETISSPGLATAIDGAWSPLLEWSATPPWSESDYKPEHETQAHLSQGYGGPRRELQRSDREILPFPMLEQSHDQEPDPGQRRHGTIFVSTPDKASTAAIGSLTAFAAGSRLSSGNEMWRVGQLRRAKHGLELPGSGHEGHHVQLPKPLTAAGYSVAVERGDLAYDIRSPVKTHYRYGHRDLISRWVGKRSTSLRRKAPGPVRQQLIGNERKQVVPAIHSSTMHRNVARSPGTPIEMAIDSGLESVSSGFVSDVEAVSGTEAAANAANAAANADPAHKPSMKVPATNRPNPVLSQATASSSATTKMRKGRYDHRSTQPDTKTQASRAGETSHKPSRIRKGKPGFVVVSEHIRLLCPRSSSLARNRRRLSRN